MNTTPNVIIVLKNGALKVYSDRAVSVTEYDIDTLNFDENIKDVEALVQGVTFGMEELSLEDGVENYLDNKPYTS